MGKPRQGKKNGSCKEVSLSKASSLFFQPKLLRSQVVTKDDHAAGPSVERCLSRKTRGGREIRLPLRSARSLDGRGISQRLVPLPHDGSVGPCPPDCSAERMSNVGAHKAGVVCATSGCHPDPSRNAISGRERSSAPTWSVWGSVSLEGSWGHTARRKSSWVSRLRPEEASRQVQGL